jgi:hypothetical protein
MPEEEVIERAREDKRQGKSPSTQAGEFVREEMEHIREGKHGARSPQQAIAIGLSKARRAGVALPAPKATSAKTRAQARRDTAKGRTSARRRPSRVRSRATSGALKREGRSAASHASLSRQAKSTVERRGRHTRRQSAMRAVRAKKKAGRKAARTRRG